MLITISLINSNNKNQALNQPSKRQPNKMLKHTQTICREQLV